MKQALYLYLKGWCECTYNNLKSLFWSFVIKKVKHKASESCVCRLGKQKAQYLNIFNLFILLETIQLYFDSKIRYYNNFSRHISNDLNCRYFEIPLHMSTFCVKMRKSKDNDVLIQQNHLECVLAIVKIFGGNILQIVFVLENLWEITALFLVNYLIQVS